MGTMFYPLKAAFNAVGLDLNKFGPWSALEHAFPGIGREFMPALDEGSFLYMPSLLPAASLSEVMESLKKQDVLMKQIPEIESVVGKLGRAESALDPAPIGMIETVVNLKPKSQWRMLPEKRWHSDLNPPGFIKDILTWAWPEERRLGRAQAYGPAFLRRHDHRIDYHLCSPLLLLRLQGTGVVVGT